MSVSLIPSLYLNAVEFELLEALLDAQVRFVIVGGHAVQFHGHVRPAKDLDILIEPSHENAARLATALRKVNIPIDHDQETKFTEKLVKPKVQVPLKGVHRFIEILTSINLVGFDEAFEQATHCVEKGRKIPVLSKEHLIRSKRARGEDRDLQDIQALSECGP